MLQHADDTIFMFEARYDSAIFYKSITRMFELMSGLKINYDKSEICCFCEVKDNEIIYKDIFTCVCGDFPMKYLGIPMHNVKLRNSD